VIGSSRIGVSVFGGICNNSAGSLVRLYKESGSSGKVALLAALLDTFPEEAGTRPFYIGTRAPPG